jgi:2-keto-4-pentenoate hydratase
MALDLKELARRMLADFDALTPGRMFAEPCDLSVPVAYALQAEIAGLREQRGEMVIGYKVGCTSPAMQRQLGLAEPIFARIFDTGRFPSESVLSHRRFANLAVEGELAVRLGAGLAGTRVDARSCRAAIVSVFPVIELHHYVLQSPQPLLAELVANGGMHAGLVCPNAEARAGNLADLQSLALWIDETQMGAVPPTDLTGRVEQSLSWLAQRLAEVGTSLVKDQIVLTGSLLNLYPVQPGNRIVAALESLGRSSAVVGP